jgi:ubiquitin carboxyl-terminal hydrolase 34
VYKSLYALHALREFVEGARQSQNPTRSLIDAHDPSDHSLRNALKTSLSLVVQALSDETLTKAVPEGLQLQLIGSLMNMFLQLFQGKESMAEN